MKVVSIVGARPQFIKMAALHRALEKQNGLRHFILHTGQHYDDNMSAVFFNELDLPAPDFHLAPNEPSTASSTGRMLPAIEQVLLAEKPSVVVVYGDTNSTLAGALAAKNLDLKLAHVEAGLRSYDNSMPEEINRIETDKISDLLFCPTTTAISNLLKEGFDNRNGRLVLSGDIMLDAINYYRKKGNGPGNVLSLAPKHEFILCTIHRQNLVQAEDKLKEVISALNDINSRIPVFMPAHPRFRKVVADYGLKIDFKLEEPVGYLGMLALLSHCSAVITDSGGLQKEAFFCKKPCVTVRNETEWTELVAAGVNFIAGDSSAPEILSAFERALQNKNDFNGNFYGDGNAAGIIIKELANYC